jgi:hypothetical protein
MTSGGGHFAARLAAQVRIPDGDVEDRALLITLDDTCY